jgi:hypothetical protein
MFVLPTQKKSLIPIIKIIIALIFISQKSPEAGKIFLWITRLANRTHKRTVSGLVIQITINTFYQAT